MNTHCFWVVSPRGSIPFCPPQMAWMILIADDGADDAVLLRHALEQVGVANPISSVRSGAELLRLLRGEPPYEDREKCPLPKILFLDVNLPLNDDFGVLRWVRSQPELKELQIFVVGERVDVTTVQRLYKAGANSFLRKPYNEVDLENLIQAFPKFWMR